MKKFHNQVLGSLVGLAVGDALGAPVEFKKRGSFSPVTKYQDGGEFNLKAGQWTDDTSLMLCLLMSFIEKKEFDLTDQMNRFMKWWKEGYMSSTGLCFDIGNTTKASLKRYEQSLDPLSGDINDKASNGALMRLAPIPLFFHHDLNSAIHYSSIQTQCTHGPKECLESAKILSYVIYSLINGEDKKDVLSFKNFKENVSLQFNPIIQGDIFNYPQSKINAEGLAYNTLEAALFAFYHFDNFYDGLCFVVNLGEDSDTVGAVYGQIAGCYYGLSEIPSHLIVELYKGEWIINTSLEFAKIIEK